MTLLDNRYWKALDRGSHIFRIFRPGTEDHHDMAFGFLKAALDKGEMAVFVTREGSNLIKRAMEKYLGNMARLEAEGQLRILSSQLVYPRGFEQKSVLSAFSDIYKQAISSGFKGLSVADVTFLGENEDHLRNIVECDKSYDGLKLGATTLCMYEGADRYDLIPFAKLMLCHSVVINHRFHLQKLPERFLRNSIESGLIEVLGENSAKAILFHLFKLAKTASVGDFLLKVEEEPELLARTLKIIFGESSNVICKVIKEKLADLVE